MIKIAIIAVIVVALLLTSVISARLGFFRFGGTILGSMFKKPATLMYPVVPREWEERTRGAVGIDGDNCIGCGLCAKACPTCAIEVDKAEGKWTIQRMQCIQCSACVDSCPKKCLTMDNQYTIPDVEKVVDTVEIPAKGAKKAAAAGGAADADGDLTCADSCVFCGLCVKACPADAIKVDRKAKSWEVDKEACIKCGACIDKCPKKSLSFGGAAAPAEKAAAEPAKKTIAVVDDEKCVYCAACVNECAAEAIKVEADSWQLDEEKCIGCGACEGACPTEAISMKEA